MQDAQLPSISDDGSIDGTALQRIFNRWIELGERRGVPFGTEPCNYQRYMEEVGFVDIHVEVMKWPTGPWMEEERMKQIGLWWRTNQIRGWEAVQRAGKFPGGDIEMEAVRKDVMNPDVHSYMNL